MLIQNHQLVHIIIKICNKDEIMTVGNIQKLHSKYQDIQRCKEPWKTLVYVHQIKSLTLSLTTIPMLIELCRTEV